MHFKIQQHGFWIRCLPIDQFITGRVPPFGGAVLNEAASGKVRRGLADVCAYADAINRHGISLAPSKK
jgi:hypothetical protein